MLKIKGKDRTTVTSIIPSGELERFYEIRSRGVKDLIDAGNLVRGWISKVGARFDRTLVISAIAEITGERRDELTKMLDAANIYEMIRHCTTEPEALATMKNLARGKLTHVIDLLKLNCAEVLPNGTIVVNYTTSEQEDVTTMTAATLADLAKDFYLGRENFTADVRAAKARVSYYERCLKDAQKALNKLVPEKKRKPRQSRPNNIVQLRKAG